MATEEDLSENHLNKIEMDDSHKASSVLPWDRFQNWLHCLCIVTFDLELGQAMEVKLPYEFRLFVNKTMSTSCRLLSCMTDLVKCTHYLFQLIYPAHIKLTEKEVSYFIIIWMFLVILLSNKFI